MKTKLKYCKPMVLSIGDPGSNQLCHCQTGSSATGSDNASFCGVGSAAVALDCGSGAGNTSVRQCADGAGVSNAAWCMSGGTVSVNPGFTCSIGNLPDTTYCDVGGSAT
jgi:hypothetical protein